MRTNYYRAVFEKAEFTMLGPTFYISCQWGLKLGESQGYLKGDTASYFVVSPNHHLITDRSRSLLKQLYNLKIPR